MRTLPIVYFLLISTLARSQNLISDLEDGLYGSSPDGIFVRELKNDSIFSFKLWQSESHYTKILETLYDSLPSKGMSRYFKGSKKGTGKLKGDFFQLTENHSCMVYKRDTSYLVTNFVREENYYLTYFTRISVTEEDLPQKLKSDPGEYFKYHLFTISDMARLKTMKEFKKLSKEEFNELLLNIENSKSKYWDLIQRHSRPSLYGTIENNEILVTILLELGINPILKAGEFDELYKKYKGG